MSPSTPSFGPAAIVPVGEASATENSKAGSVMGGAPWWARYRASVEGRLSPTALSVLEEDARYIIEKALPRTGDALEVVAWSETRVRTGMVVGSVQSGKTASMLGVAAMALDAGVDLLILLAGPRVSLWLQTYERLLGQLDGSTPDNAYRRRPTPNLADGQDRATQGPTMRRPESSKSTQDMHMPEPAPNNAIRGVRSEHGKSAGLR